MRVRMEAGEVSRVSGRFGLSGRWFRRARVAGRIGSAGPVVVDKLGDELLGAAAAIVHQLQRGLAVIERKAAPDEDSEFS